MADACVFCESEQNLSQEHVISDWVNKVLPFPGVPYQAVRRSTSESPGVLQVTGMWKRKNIDETVGVVCRACNNGWMATLEDRAKPLLTPMIRGKGIFLSESARLIIATWMAKTALIGPYSLGHEAGRTRREWLFRRQVPPPQTSIVAARYVGQTIGTEVQVHSLTLERRRGHSPRAEHATHLVVTITVGHLVFQMVEHPFRDVVPNWADNGDYLVLLHPGREPLTLWPPKYALSEAGVYELADRFIDFGMRPDRSIGPEWPNATEPPQA